MARSHTGVGRPVIRQRLATLGFLALLLALAVRLTLIQTVEAADLAQDALENRLQTQTIETVRADIVDRNGITLATSVERYDVWVDQVTLADWEVKENGAVLGKGPLYAASLLAPVLEVSEAELAADLVGDATFRYLQKDASADVWDLIDELGIAGIHADPVSERFYPAGVLAGNITGFMSGSADSVEDVAQAGLELSFDDVLSGVDGSYTYENGNKGYVIPNGVYEEEAAVPGQTVVTTIDSDIQWYAQQRLEEAIDYTYGSGGIAIVMDVATGEILALAEHGSLDPNDPGATDASLRGSTSAEDVYEPGSTGKIITMAAALEEGIVTPTDEYEAPYQYTTENNQTFQDTHDYGTRKLTVNGILAKSSNTGTIQIGEQMSAATYYDYLEAFGIGQPTGVGLPIESSGLLNPLETLDGRSRYAMLYGQAYSVTALQAVQVYATIANDGVLSQPTLVRGFEDVDGTFTPYREPSTTQVISTTTAETLQKMLESVTEEGTGTTAQIQGYRVGGKTGTAEILEGGKVTGFTASFIGFAPADDPELVVAVTVFDPEVNFYGSEAAAPAFKDIMEFSLQNQGVAPSQTTATLYPITWE